MSLSASRVWKWHCSWDLQLTLEDAMSAGMVSRKEVYTTLKSKTWPNVLTREPLCESRQCDVVVGAEFERATQMNVGRRSAGEEDRRLP